MGPSPSKLALKAIAAACLASAAAADPDRDPCRALARALPGEVHLPDSAAYRAENMYWSNRQAEARPRCFVTPRGTMEVSRALKTLTELRAPFSVKSGGHTAFEGGSGADKGVTIDLVNFREVTVWSDNKTVTVGAGNRWINVSRALDPLGLAVVGGRAADVGVSGLILGGGISYFSGTRGWACDNVRSFRVVVSSGDAVTASPTENQDLYWALRGGGGSSFGIVVSFDLEAFPQADLWTNSIIFPGASNKTLIPLFTHLSNRGLVENPQAHAYFVLSYQPGISGFAVLTSFFQSTPLPNHAVPSVFQPFQSVPGAVSNVAQVVNISTQSMAIDQPSGSRQTWWDTSVSMASPKLFEDIVSMYEDYVHKLLEAAKGSKLTTFLVFQPISQNVVDAMQKNGGNALGLKPSDGPLMIVQISVQWSDKNLDSVVEGSSQSLIEDVETLSKARGLFRGFIYMNYAGKSQDVFGRYGRESYDRLKKTAFRWDPNGLLEDLWKGYFQVRNFEHD
ncbi:hypothetical protein CDD83_6413 [Cordyceps sp. RAO-2017]|nr:hypothetical protein CDD83_6413 [Cordyceps sp. RAO-2017]